MKTYSKPFICVRDIVIFPSNTAALMIGRPFTIETVNCALEKYDGELVVATQKHMAQDERPKLEEIFNMGVTCRIENKVSFSDNSMKILLRATDRFIVESLAEEGMVRFATGKIVSAQAPNETLSEELKNEIVDLVGKAMKHLPKEESEIYSKLKAETNLTCFVEVAAHLLNYSQSISLKKRLEAANQGKSPQEMLSRDETTKLDVKLAERQAILEELDVNARLEKIRFHLSQASA